MIKELVSIAILILVFFGFTALSYYVILKLLRTKKSGQYSLVLCADDSGESVVNRLCSEFIRMELLGELSYGKIIVVDCGMNENQRRECNDFCAQTKNVFICAPRELERLVCGEAADACHRML